jgi:arsenate reductase
MAEAIARHIADDIIAAESAGVQPLGFIDNTTQMVLRERQISFEGQFSKSLHNHKLRTPDLIVNMSGIPGQSLFAGKELFSGKEFEDWKVPDPFGEAIETHRRICDHIEARVKELAVRLRQAQQAENSNERSADSAS